MLTLSASMALREEHPAMTGGFPRTKASNAKFCCLLCCHLFKQTSMLLMFWDCMAFMWRHGNDLHRPMMTYPGRRGTEGLHPGYSWTVWKELSMFSIFQLGRNKKRTNYQETWINQINRIWRLHKLTQQSSGQLKKFWVSISENSRPPL